MRCAPWCLSWCCDGPCTRGVVSGEPRPAAARTLPATTTAQITPDGVERDRKDAERYRKLKTMISLPAFCEYQGWHPNDYKQDVDAAVDRAIELVAARTLVTSPDTRINPDVRPTGQINPDVINPSPVAAVGDS